MGDFLSTAYPWIKAFHIISVISWMAGLLYLPRLFVYHSEQIEAGNEDTSVFKIMEKKLFHFIMTKAMIATWIFGLLLIMTPSIAGFGVNYWIYFKILLIILLTLFHTWLGKQQNNFETDTNRHSSRTYRLVNEVPAVLMIGIVILVVVKPF